MFEHIQFEAQQEYLAIDFNIKLYDRITATTHS